MSTPMNTPIEWRLVPLDALVKMKGDSRIFIKTTHNTARVQGGYWVDFPNPSDKVVIVGNAPARPYSTSEAAALLGISASQVRRHCALGRCPGAYRPHPRTWLIPASGIDALRAWAAKQRDNPSTRIPSKIG